MSEGRSPNRNHTLAKQSGSPAGDRLPGTERSRSPHGSPSRNNDQLLGHRGITHAASANAGVHPKVASRTIDAMGGHGLGGGGNAGLMGGHLRVKSKSPDRQRGGGIGSTLADAASGSPTRGSPTTLSGHSAFTTSHGKAAPKLRAHLARGASPNSGSRPPLPSSNQPGAYHTGAASAAANFSQQGPAPIGKNGRPTAQGIIVAKKVTHTEKIVSPSSSGGGQRTPGSSSKPPLPNSPMVGHSMGAQAQQGGTSALRRGMQGSTANKGGSSPALQGHSMQKGIGGRAGPQGAHQLPYSSDRHHQLGGLREPTGNILPAEIPKVIRIRCGKCNSLFKVRVPSGDAANRGFQVEVDCPNCKNTNRCVVKARPPPTSPLEKALSSDRNMSSSASASGASSAYQ